MFQIRIDRLSGVPLYVQIKDQITYEISVAHLPAGTVLPSIRRLASHAGVATATVRHAYAALIDEGFVVAHQGKGMLVAELEHRSPLAEDPAGGRLVSLFSASIGRAFSLGARMDEIQTAIEQALQRWTGASRVLFVASEPEFIDHYLPILREHLQDLAIEIEPVHLADVVAGRSSDRDGKPLGVVTLARGYDAVRRALGHLGVPITGLTVVLSDTTKAELMDLTRQQRVVLVAERMNLAGMHTLIEQYLALDAPIRLVALETDDLAAALRGTDVVVQTLRGRPKVLRAMPPSARLLELRFLPDPVSVERLRRTIDAQRRGGPDLNAAK